MFNDDVAHAIVASAKTNGIEPAALLAIVEVETGGKTFENDGRTPQFLYERHVAWREAVKISDAVLAAFRRAGLAIPKWNRATQYSDQRTSSMRLQLIGRARAIHEECADRSASWGLGQTMGNLAQELGFPSAVAMVAHMTGSVSGQIDCMVRELKHTNLIKSLNAQDWTRVARVYNGPGYAANRYDVRLRDAYARWARKLPRLGTPEDPRQPPPEQSLAEDEIRDIQQKLRDLGYHEVGEPDGRWGDRTIGAWSAFQAHEGLHVTGHYDEAGKAALDAAELSRPVSTERAEATVEDLRDAGSDTIAHADSLTTLGTFKSLTGGGLLAGGVADQTGMLGKASDFTDKIDQAQGLLSRLHDLAHPILGQPSIVLFGVVLLAAGIAVAVIAKRIRDNRLKDHQTGVHAGPGA